jgi:hypothetical protein
MKCHSGEKNYSSSSPYSTRNNYLLFSWGVRKYPRRIIRGGELMIIIELKVLSDEKLSIVWRMDWGECKFWKSVCRCRPRLWRKRCSVSLISHNWEYLTEKHFIIDSVSSGEHKLKY